MNEQDKMWFDKCKQEPNRYKIYVDNDCVSIEDVTTDDDVYAFTEYGYYFALQLLQYMGCNAELI